MKFRRTHMQSISEIKGTDRITIAAGTLQGTAAQRLTAERFGERLGELLGLAQGCSELPSSPRVSGNPPLAAGYMPDPSREAISDTADDTRLPAIEDAAFASPPSQDC